MSYKMCGWHKPMKLSYLQWHDWADEISKVESAYLCAECDNWFFESEFGNPVALSTEIKNTPVLKEIGDA
jgi:hypothetical protein